ncbi:MAG: TetR/AcrR family transcriptional regulator [Chthoniobacteraceae bacterium]
MVSAAMQTRTLQRQARRMPGGNRERIVAGARRHFFAQGFRSVTMSDLAVELGMSKKTLYVHFPGKTALLEAMIDDKLAHIHADLAEIMDTEKIAFPEKLRRLLAGLRRHTAEIQPAFVRDVRKEAPELFARIQQGRRKLIHRCFGKLIEDGRKAGAIRSDIPVKLLIEMLIGTVDAVLVPARMEELGITLRTGFAQIISVFVEGVLVRKRGAK